MTKYKIVTPDVVLRVRSMTIRGPLNRANARLLAMADGPRLKKGRGDDFLQLTAMGEDEQ